MNQERKNRMNAWYASIGIHATLLLVLGMALAWQAPDPPIPAYGIELGLVADRVDQKAQDQPKISETPEDREETEDAPAEEENDAPSEVHETLEDTPEATENTPTEEETRNDMPTEDVHSPDVVEPTSPNELDAQNVTPHEEQAKDAKKAAKKTAQNVPDAKAEIDPRAIFKKDKTSGAGTAGKSSSLELVGWDWDAKPQPHDTSAETGVLVFQITIDSEGEIIGIKTLKTTVSPAVEQVYRNTVMALTFSKKSDNRSAAPTSTGKITFTIQSK